MPGAVFISYASQDAEAARRICEALRARGVEVWFDQSELVGGDAWDQKIRKQIRECALFVPILSKTTQGRREAYFRLEWKLADERTHLMAKGTPFLLPVTIDETGDREALVPDSFLAVQWTKAPGGEVAATFGARVKTLLGNEASAGPGLPTPSQTAKTTGVGSPARQRTTRTPRWVWPVLAGVVVVAVGLGVPFFKRLRRESAAAPAKAPTTMAVAENLSPARQLVERARAILDKGELTRAQLDAAGELCDRALQLDTTDPLVWAQAARSDLLLIYPYGYDRSAERRRQAQARATRAASLGPDEFEVQVIQAVVFAHAVGTPALLAEAEKTIRALISAHPGDNELVRQLAEILREGKRFSEAAKLFESIGEFEVAGWSYFEGGDLRPALAAVDRALREKRSVTALQLKAILQYSADGDLEAAQATFNQLRPSELLSEMSGTGAIRLAFYRRDPERMLELAGGLDRDYLDSNSFRGPRGYYTGLAHELAGRPVQAETEWRAALAIVESRLKPAPDDRELLLWSAWLHAALGDTMEAEKKFAHSQAVGGLSGDTMDEVNLPVLLRLRKKEALMAGTEKLLRTKPPRWAINYAEVRFSPQADFLREDPRFKKLLRDSLPESAKPLED